MGEIREYVDGASVVVDGVSKTYVIMESRSEDASVLKQKEGRTAVHALQNASFFTLPGESVGIIGLNGSGKSTLLKMIAGAEVPTTGRIMTRSKPMLLGVAPALQRNLSGKHNIYLGCLALGMDPARAKAQIPIIAEWTELKEAIERPLATYSSGMSARLAFAISTSVEPDILLIDEALSTGDAAFGEKADRRMEELLERAGNLFLVSHAIGQIEKLCQRTIWISKGKIIADGATEEVAPMYHEWARLMGKENKDPAHEYLQEVVDSYEPPFLVLD